MSRIPTTLFIYLPRSLLDKFSTNKYPNVPNKRLIECLKSISRRIIIQIKSVPTYIIYLPISVICEQISCTSAISGLDRFRAPSGRVSDTMRAIHHGSLTHGISNKHSCAPGDCDVTGWTWLWFYQPMLPWYCAARKSEGLLNLRFDDQVVKITHLGIIIYRRDSHIDNLASVS